jgi:hypothetical protein
MSHPRYVAHAHEVLNLIAPAESLEVTFSFGLLRG